MDHPWSVAATQSAGQEHAPPPAEDPTEPQLWRQITVDVPGPEFEARPPALNAYHPPDTECDGWSTSELTLRFASVRGAHHRYYGRPRQDSARAAVYEHTGTIVFAVADGVSRAVNPELGAVEACESAVHRMLHILAEDAGPIDFQEVAYDSAERLRELTQSRLDLRDPTLAEVAELYATTLVAGIVRPEPDGPVAELFRIGDSNAWVLDRTNGEYGPLFSTKTGSDEDVVSNEVASLPYVPDPLEQIVTVRLPSSETLLVGTDGFGDPLGDGDGLVGTLFARHLLTPPPPVWLAHVLDFSRETFDDDRTLLAVWPRTSAE